jgi:Stress responsive A/B Barrel Domain
MIRHIALFTWTPGATDEQKQRVRAELAALPDRIPGIRDLQFGADAGLVAAGNADFALTADFAGADAYLAYRTHPAHLEFIEQTINPILAQRVSAQIEI